MNTYSLSHAQLRILYSETLNTQSHSNNLFLSYSLPSSKYNLDTIKLSLNSIVSNNDIFRFTLRKINNEIAITYLENNSTDIPVIHYKGENAEQLKQKWKEQEAQKPFSLFGTELYSLFILTTSEKIDIVAKFHHIISDVWSWGLFSKQFAYYYTKETNKSVDVMTLSSGKYINYIRRESEYKISEQFEIDKTYWNNKFSTLPEVQFPIVGVITKNISSRRFEYRLSKEKTNVLRLFCKAKNTSVFKTLIAAIYTYFSRVTQTQDYIIGIPMHNRFDKINIDTMGMFVSTIPFRINAQESQSVLNLLDTIADNLRLDIKHQKYPFDLLIKDLREKNNTVGQMKLFDVVFSYQKVDFADIFEKIDWVHHGADTFPIVIHANDSINNDSLSFLFDYQVENFTEMQISALAISLESILNQIMSNPTIPIGEIDIVTATEKDIILNQFNNTTTNYSKNKSIVENFSNITNCYPQHIALQSIAKTYTYKELDEATDRMAGWLIDNGCNHGDSIGVLLDRGTTFVVSILAILKAEAVYVPIDIDYPKERIAYMIKDSQIKFVVSDPCNSQILPECVKVLYTDQIKKSVNHSLISPSLSPSDLCYIIYTSGSTGAPKGVMVEHRNVIRLVKNTNYINLTTNDVLLQTGAPVFDATTFEIWGCLLNGARLCIIDSVELLNPNLLESRIKEFGITTMWFTSSYFNQLSDHNPNLFSGLKYLLVGGDILSPTHINAIRTRFPQIQVINGYGPTENTTFSTTFLIEDEYPNIPIGKPVANSSAYVVDHKQRLLPIGITGELCTGGDGVARGYVANQSDTEEKFINNPYANGKLYKSGDLARYLPDGNIVFMGRKDNQFKIRGFRVELQEIEYVCKQHESIKDCIVIINTKSNGDKSIVLYYVADSLAVESLQMYLHEKLPLYMLPSALVKMEAFPLNQNGKINQAKLPKPIIQTSRDSELQEHSESQNRLICIWEDILEIQNIGIRDNFFELGGHSLNGMYIVSLVGQQFSIELTLSDLFNNPTIEDLSTIIDKKNKEEVALICKMETAENYKLSPAQKRFFLLNQIESYSTNYNIPIIFRVGKSVNLKRLYLSFAELVKRHDIFRTSFRMNKNEPIQKVHPEVIIPLRIYDEQDMSIDNIKDVFFECFDLDHSPLFRVGYIKAINNNDIIMIDVHHIIMDGESFRVINKELDEIYSGKLMPAPTLQYKDYVAWILKQNQTTVYEKQKQYWVNKLSGELPIMNLPYDYQRPTKQCFDGYEFDFQADKKLYVELKEICAKSGVTLYMLLLAAFNVLLSKCSRQEDILVGTPVSGRNHPETRNMVGVFINTLVLRNAPVAKLSFSEFLSSVKQNTLEAFENQSYPFEDLLNEINVTKDISRNAVFDAMFVVQDVSVKHIRFDNIEVYPFDFKYKTSKLDILLEAFPTADKLSFTLGYCTALFKADTIASFAGYYLNILEQIVVNIDIKLRDISVLSKKEEEHIVYGFNQTYFEVDASETVLTLFKRQLDSIPYNIAVSYKGKQLTFEELDLASDKIAYTILAKNVKQCKLVGLMMDRTERLFVALLGILKSGFAYLPIDKEFPKHRIKYMLEKGQVELIVTEKNLTDVLEFNGERICWEDIFSSTSTTVDKAPTLPIINVKDLAYVIFTSGSTGNPKGVKISHGAIVNFIKGMQQKIDFSTCEPILCLTTISFDIFVLESLLPLASGKPIVLADENEQHDSNRLNKLILESGVKLLQITPSRLQLLMLDKSSTETLSSISTIMVGGEALPLHLFESLKKYPRLKIYNMYGPTETTVWSTVKDLTNSTKITIGKPIVNTCIYILNPNLQPTPLRTVGEMYIGGKGLSDGYYNDQELTDERFIPNPFIEGELLYNTGDLAKWKKNGDIEFVGRADSQIKIRGYRIELAEVEGAFAKCKDVNESAIIVDKDNFGYNRLVAYYTSKSSIDQKIIRDALKETLPPYMVPDFFIHLESMPLTPNCKIDRKALPKVTYFTDKNTPSLKKPTNKIQHKLLEIWKDVLQNNNIGINDVFFEVGGNSLLLVVMQSKIDEIYPKKVHIADIFSNPTISHLAKLIEKSGLKPKNIALSKTAFPLDYFSNVMTSSYTENVLSNTLNPIYTEALNELCKNLKTTHGGIFASAFSYLLSKMTSSTDLNFYVYKNNLFYEISLDIAGMKGFDQIVTSFNELLAMQVKAKGFSAEELDQADIRPADYKISTLIVVGDRLPDNAIKLFDLKLCCELIDSNIAISLSYNSQRLNTGKMELYFKNVIKILQQLFQNSITTTK